NWINSGFAGNPSYVTDPQQFFLSIGDQAAAETISQSSLAGLCSPFSAQVRLALVKQYLYDTNPAVQCSLGNIANNFQNFANNFSQGGWNSWFQITQNASNNPYGSYLQAQAIIANKISTRQTIAQNQLNQGLGFLSYKKCNPHGQSTIVNISSTNLAGSGNDELNTQNTAYQECYNDYHVPGVSDADLHKNCDKYLSSSLRADVVNDGSGNACLPEDMQTVTPGSVIANQLNNSLSLGPNLQLTAKSIDEVVGALLTQMFQKVVGATGLGGAGSSNAVPPSSNPADLVDSLNNQKPQIYLNGPKAINLNLGTPYTDQGATAFDFTDGDISQSISSSGTVDDTAVGTYIITYTVTNSKGVSADPVTRTIIVGNQENAASIISGDTLGVGAGGSGQSNSSLTCTAPCNTEIYWRTNPGSIARVIRDKDPSNVFTTSPNGDELDSKANFDAGTHYYSLQVQDADGNWEDAAVVPVTVTGSGSGSTSTGGSGSSGGTTINGECGTSNGGTFPSQPTTNLCSQGTATSITGITGSWVWQCMGSGAGINASCSANVGQSTPSSPVAATVTLQANPVSEPVTFAGPITLTAANSDTGQYYYYFYCDRSQTDTVPPAPNGFINTLALILNNTYTSPKQCSYTAQGTYHPKVISLKVYDALGKPYSSTDAWRQANATVTIK